jgi:protein disulfide-isomerase A1
VRPLPGTLNIHPAATRPPQELAPEYEKAAAILANGESKIRLGKVDATVEEVVAAKFQVDGFPTLKFFRDGVPSEYGGPRQAQGIADWLVKKTGPQFTVANSKAELDLVLEEKGILAVGFFADPESEAAEVFKEVAAGQDDVDFFIISSAAVMAEYHRTDSSILVLKTFDDTEVHFAETLTKENLQKFIEKSARPLVTEFTQENAAKIFGSGIMHHFLLLSGKKEPEFGSSMDNVSVRKYCVL